MDDVKYSEKAKSLIERAVEVKVETDEDDNSAQRVGQLLEDMIKYTSEEEQTIIAIVNDTDTLKGRVNDLQEAISQGVGPGNNSGSVKIESRKFYKNLEHSNQIPQVPNLTNFRLTSSNVGGWDYENTNPEDEGHPDYDTWQIIVQFVNTVANSIIGPIRLKDGSRPNSSNGEDTDEIEFIYCRPSNNANGLTYWDETNTAALLNYSSQHQDKISGSVILDNIEWYDHPNGITRDYKYEYYSYRTSSIVNGVVTWSDFCFPMIWSAWGDKGEDGDGVEYIFYASVDGTFNEGTIINGHGINHPDYWDVDGATAPGIYGRNDKTFQDNEFIARDSAWQDNPVDLNGEGYGPGSKQWVSVRKKQLVERTRHAGQPTEYVETVHEWTSYSPAALWSGVGNDSTVEGYIVDLVNENMPVVVDVNGNIPTEYKNQGRVQVQGSSTRLSPTTWNDNDDPDDGYFMCKVDTITYSDNRTYSSGNEAIVPTIDGANLNVTVRTTISNFYGVTCNIKLKVKLPDGSISYLICTVYGIYIDGIENIDMYIGAPCIHVDASGLNPSPSSLQVGVKIGRNRSDTTTYISGDNEHSSAEDQRFYFKYYFDDDTSHVNLSDGGNIPLNDGFSHTSVTVEMYYKDNSNNLIFIDRERVPYVKDGSSSAERRKKAGIPYYKAFSSTSTTKNAPTTKPNSQYAPIDGWSTDINYQNNWNENNPYLYITYYIEYEDNPDDWYWEAPAFYRSWEANEIVNGKDGYTIVVTPTYAILEESVTTDESGEITSRSYNYDSWSATIQVLKENDPQVIGYRKSVSGTKNCSFDVNSSTDNKTLTVTITGFSNNPQIVTGNIGIIITKGSNDFAAVNIPIYVNRVGTRTQTIKGDVESTVFDKIIYDLRPDGSITTLKQLGTYIRTSGQNIVNLTRIITDPGGLSERVNNFEQTAGSLESSIKNMNIGTKNYFNFTYCQFMSTAFPFIQGYGLEGYGNNMQVRNLDFEGKGGDFVVTCQMRLQSGNTPKKVLVGLCDSNPVNIQSNNGYVDVTNVWKQYTFVYKDIPDSKTNPSSVNGHITFSVENGFDNEHRLYVKNLMIARGSTPSDFNISWKDYESTNTRNSALVISDDMWYYRNTEGNNEFKLIKQNEKYKGYDVYKCVQTQAYQSNPTPDQDTYQTSYEHYIDAIAYSNITLQKGKIYTLSFYAKINDANAVNTEKNSLTDRAAYMYGGSGNFASSMGIDEATKQVDTKYNTGYPSKGNKTDGYTTYKFNTEWQQFIIHWYNDSSSSRNFVVMRLPRANSSNRTRQLVSFQQFSIAGVELREGWWDVEGINSSSLIRQTADEIEMKVKDTGINIDDGTIKLDADSTIINGGLNLYGQDQGFKLYNNDGYEKISIFPSEIPSLQESFIDASAHKKYYSFQTGTVKHFEEEAISTASKTVTFRVDLGNVIKGGTVKIPSLHVTCAEKGNVDYTLTILINNNEVKTDSDTVSYRYRNGYVITVDQVVAPQEGAVTLVLTLNNVSPVCPYYLSLFYEIIASSLNKIGSNGAIFAHDIGNFHWFGPSKTVISHSKGLSSRQLIIDDTGIYNNDTDIGGQVNVKILTESGISNNNVYEASIKDTFIVIPKNFKRDVSIYLPKPMDCMGKVYYIKKLNSVTVNLFSQDNDPIIASNNNTPATPPFKIEYDSYMFISTGSEWVHFSCR